MTRRTDERILDAACEVFAVRGYQQATMDSIAERAGSTKPTLYSHFGDKDALYRAVLAREATALGAWVTTAYQAASGLPVEGQVRVYVMALFTYATKHPESFRLLLTSPVEGEAAQPRRELVELITQSVADQVRRYLADHGRTAGPSADLLAVMMVTMVGQAAEWTVAAKAVDPLAAGNLACGLIIAALPGLDPDLLDAIDR